jgi:DNA-binding XRE family transcriptional regulator
MGEDPSTASAPVTSSEHPEQIREEIEATREELGETVAALAQKADVKAQAKQKIEGAKASVSEKKDELLGRAREASPDSAATAASDVSRKARENPLPLAAAGAFAIGFLAGRRSAR